MCEHSPGGTGVTTVDDFVDAFGLEALIDERVGQYHQEIAGTYLQMPTLSFSSNWDSGAYRAFALVDNSDAPSIERNGFDVTATGDYSFGEGVFVIKALKAGVYGYSGQVDFDRQDHDLFVAFLNSADDFDFSTSSTSGWKQFNRVVEPYTAKDFSGTVSLPAGGAVAFYLLQTDDQNYYADASISFSMNRIA